MDPHGSAEDDVAQCGGGNLKFHKFGSVKSPSLGSLCRAKSANDQSLALCQSLPAFGGKLHMHFPTWDEYIMNVERLRVDADT